MGKFITIFGVIFCLHDRFFAFSGEFSVKVSVKITLFYFVKALRTRSETLAT